MKRKNLIPALLAAAAVMLALSGCGKEPAPAEPAAPAPAAHEAVMPDPNPPVARKEAPEVPAAPAAKTPEEPSSEPSSEPAPEESPEPTPKATPVPPPTIVTAPVPTPVPKEPDALRPGTYEGADGSVLTVEADGTCTLVTEVSGKVNGKSMSADLTFHGTVEAGTFAFDKVTYGRLDLTAIAAAAGYTDASPWEAVAEILYNLG